MTTTPVGPTPTPTTPTPHFDVWLYESPSAFVAQAGLDEIGAARIVGKIELRPDAHTPGVVHGREYGTAIESAVSIGASNAAIEQDRLAAGLTNTAHFLRAFAAAQVKVEACFICQGRPHQAWRADIPTTPGA